MSTGDWASIPGWFSVAEARALRTLAAGRTVLELGSYCGRSTVAAAEVANRIVSVDRHTGDRGTGPSDTLATFLATLARFGVADRVEVIVGDIAEVGPTLPDASFDLVFIDSAHDAASVARDARIALRCVKPGGTIAWHDAHYDSVQAGLMQAGIEALRPDRMTDSLAWTTIDAPPDPSA